MTREEELELNLKYIKVAVDELCHIFSVDNVIRYNFDKADCMIKKSRAILGVLKEQLQIVNQNNKEQ